MDMAAVPTEEQINPYGDLDGDVAVRNLLGKNVREALALLRENSDRYSEDYLWMGAQAFDYYVQALIEYLATDEARDDAQFVNAMLSTFRLRVEQDGPASRPAIAKMREFYRNALSDSERHGLDEDERRTFDRRVARLEAAIAAIEPA